MMPETQLIKICKTCKSPLPLSEFWLAKNAKDGKRGSCKTCVGSQINKLKEQVVNAICEFQTSFRCQKQYQINLYEYNKNMKRNDGKYRCLYCGIHDTHLNNFKKYNTDSSFFNDIDSELKAYLLGIIAGDGHITKNYQVLEIVANNQDTSTLELFRKHISNNNIIRHKFGSENCNTLLICSVSLCKDICKHLKIKSGKKSNKISLPNLTNHLMIPFIRGLLDSDGWVKELSKGDRGRRCFYSSTSSKILNDVRKFMSKFDIHSSISGIKLYFNGDNASKFLNLLYKDATYFLPRKYNRFLRWSE
jgi:hypothetical protein